MVKKENPEFGTVTDVFFKRATQFPILTATEEKELAKRIEKGDLQAKEKLINHNLRLVAKNAFKYRGTRLDIEDLIQEGMFGLIRAAEKFDWRKDIKFSTYATYWIKQSIGRGVDHTNHTIKLPITHNVALRRLWRADTSLAVILGRDPTTEELTEHMNDQVEEGSSVSYTVEEVEELRHVSRVATSLNKPLIDNEGDGGGELGDLFPDDKSLRPEDEAERVDQRRVIGHALNRLTPEERKAITLRWGLLDDTPMLYKKIGEELGYHSESCRKITNNALRKLSEDEELRELALVS